MTPLYCRDRSAFALMKTWQLPVIHKAQRLKNLTKKEPSLLKLKIVRIYIRTYPIFNMADRLMNIQLYEKSPTTSLCQLASNQQVKCHFMYRPNQVRTRKPHGKKIEDNLSL